MQRKNVGPEKGVEKMRTEGALATWTIMVTIAGMRWAGDQK